MFDTLLEQITTFLASQFHLPSLPGTTGFIITVLVSLICGLLVHMLLVIVIRRLTQKKHPRVEKALSNNMKGPTRLLVMLFFYSLFRTLFLSTEPNHSIENGLRLSWLFCVSWIAFNLLNVFEDVLLSRINLLADDNLHARRIFTQFKIFQRVTQFVIVLLAIASALMTFDQLEAIGTSLLASAGVAGVVIGFAAQKSLAAILAGIQVAFTRPFQIDDVLIIEGEWGKVEEITLTYVVFRIWDQRRLIIPINRFLEKTFENWTRTSSEMLGAVIWHVAFHTNIDDMRLELERICRDEGRAYWDGRTAVIHVVESGIDSMEVRALVSAGNSSKLWELRCLVRERMVLYLLRNHPDCLPSHRLSLQDKNSASA
ncbi:mechanosensitive ion channel family protein [Desulfovibrio inopinatus]|uniref:mechanosensitive ion channel family protein n=1 Tax=Desulfovibrio inopinatus TaxID=102109 RepID=UPI0003FC5AF5|nr:mechanosensitive ion channel family protein [Desulfovibrio inopinatus]